MFAAFAAAFGGARTVTSAPAVVEWAPPDAVPQLDATLPEPPIAFPEVPAAEEAQPPEQVDVPLASDLADDPEFRDPRELLADGRPTIGIGGGPQGLRRRGAPRVNSGAALVSSQQPGGAAVVAPPPSPISTPPIGPTQPARFAATPAPPRYPETAQRRGWEGVVHLRIDIGADGSVLDVTVLRSSGRAPLDEAAVEAARSWRFDAALADGSPVRSSVEKDVRFRLEN